MDSHEELEGTAFTWSEYLSRVMAEHATPAVVKLDADDVEKMLLMREANLENPKMARKRSGSGKILNQILSMAAEDPANPHVCVEQFTCHKCGQVNFMFHHHEESVPCMSCGQRLSSRSPRATPRGEMELHHLSAALGEAMKSMSEGERTIFGRWLTTALRRAEKLAEESTDE